jgi:uncharacterized membrane-anchored protein YhcB (DUF1043 family)
MRALLIGCVMGVLAMSLTAACGEAQQEANEIADEASAQLNEAKERASEGASGKAAAAVDGAAGQAAEAVDTKGAVQAAEDAARQLEANVEQSLETEKETYEKKRAEGEGVVEAAGDAYEAVLEEGTAKAGE